MPTAAEKTALAYFAATNRKDFRGASELLYPGDLDKFKSNTLWCAQAMSPFGEAADFLKLFGPGAEIEDLRVLSPQQFTQKYMEGAMGTLCPEGWQAVVDSFRVDAVHQVSGDVAEIEYSYLAADGRAQNSMDLQRVGDDWFVHLRDGFTRSNAKVKARVEDFEQRSRRDRDPDSAEGDLEAFALWGFRNSAGEIVIEPRFGGAEDFSEGLAPVKFFNKWGYINTAGEIAIEARFDRAESFSEGLAAVANYNSEYDLRWGYVDRRGDVVIELKYESVAAFDKGVAEVWLVDDRVRYVDKLGDFVGDDNSSEAGDSDYE